MSWAISFTGKPENVLKALKGLEAVKGLDEKSAEQYDAARPQLEGIVWLFKDDDFIRISANGFEVTDGLGDKTKSFNVSIERVKMA